MPAVSAASRKRLIGQGREREEVEQGLGCVEGDRAADGHDEREADEVADEHDALTVPPVDHRADEGSDEREGRQEHREACGDVPRR